MIIKGMILIPFKLSNETMVVKQQKEREHDLLFYFYFFVIYVFVQNTGAFH